MLVHRARALAGAVLAACLAAACGGSLSPDESTPARAAAGIRAVSGASIRDTVQSSPLQSLVVEVVGPDGALARGIAVRFEPVAPADSARRAERALYACASAVVACGPSSDPSAGSASGELALDTTDAGGRASATIRLGTMAGTARVRISVPQLGLVDSVTVEVLPGAATRFRMRTRDTVTIVGVTLPLGAEVLDRLGNIRPDLVATEVVGSSVVADPKGTITARDVGRSVVRVLRGALADSVMLTVLPRGRLAAWIPFDSAVGGGLGIVSLMNFDGTDVRRIARDVDGGEMTVFPTWSTDGARVAFSDRVQFLRVVDTAGVLVRNVSGEFQGYGYYPRFTADGSGLLFVGRRLGTSLVQLWRASVDGTDPRPLFALINHEDRYGSVDISADGRRVVYMSTSGLRVMDATIGLTGAPISTTMSSPRWSPTGDRLAVLTRADGLYGDGRLTIVAPDGSGARVLTEAVYSIGFGWSPDGQWLVARQVSDRRLYLVRVSNGETIPLRFGVDRYQPAWH